MRYTISDELMEQAIQALDNAAVTLSIYMSGETPPDPLDAHTEAREAYDALHAITAEHADLDL
jgi:hypothetical protein